MNGVKSYGAFGKYCINRNGKMDCMIDMRIV